jgi:hypothetical protein
MICTFFISRVSTDIVVQPVENEGSPTNWTLRFKHGRLTILLLTEALTPISVLKTELLETLRERYPLGIPNPVPKSASRIPIPDSIQDVALAVPIDNHDISKGWKGLDLSASGGIKACPKSLGIKDGGVLAFRFRSEDEGDDEDIEKGMAEREDEFLVEWPSYDETYGEPEPQRGDSMDED